MIANPKGLLSEISLYWKNLWTCYIPVVHSICYGDLFCLNFLFVNLFVVLMCTVWTKVLRTDKSCRLFLWSREGWMWLCKPTYPCYIWPILLIPNYFHSYPDQPYFLLEIFVVWICCLKYHVCILCFCFNVSRFYQTEDLILDVVWEAS